MADYSFVPRRAGSEYFGGGGGWLTGLGSAFGGGMEAGIKQTNALREMQDNNAISPYAVSAAQSRLNEARIEGLYGAMGVQGKIDAANNDMVKRRNAQMGTPQPGTTEVLNMPGTDFSRLAQGIGEQAAVGTVNPMMTSGTTQASRMLNMPQYGYNQPLYNPSGLGYWGF